MLYDFLLTIPGVRQSIPYYPHFKDNKIGYGSQGTIWLIQFKEHEESVVDTVVSLSTPAAGLWCSMARRAKEW